MSLRSDRGEQRALAADLSAQEGRATEPRHRPVVATDYLHTAHPDTGVPVVFVPGEALPAWAAAQVEPVDLDPEPASPAAPHRNHRSAKVAVEAREEGSATT